MNKGDKVFVDFTNKEEVEALDSIFSRYCGKNMLKALFWGAIGMIGITKCLDRSSKAERNYGAWLLTQEMLKDKDK